MAHKHILQLENALADSLNEIDKLYTRKIQCDMHKCAAKCCEKTSDSIENVHNCIKHCSSDFEKVQQYLLAEYTQFQGRLQRCVLQCSDDAIDKMGVNPSTSEMAKYNQAYESCVVSCANKHIDLVPVFLRRVKDTLHRKAYLTIPLEDDPKAFRQPTLL